MIYTKPIIEKKVLENIVYNGAKAFQLTCYCTQQFKCQSSYNCSTHYCSNAY